MTWPKGSTLGCAVSKSIFHDCSLVNTVALADETKAEIIKMIPPVLATEAQIKYMQNLRVEIPLNVSLTDASALISFAIKPASSVIRSVLSLIVPSCF